MFHHVSTDEVYGSLGADGLFTEETRYDPSSPYSASKASSDHLVRAYARTYGLRARITNCSNNYGPLQFPEKLIPLMIAKALAGDPLPVYGDGRNVRDWLYVGDHCSAIRAVLEEDPSLLWGVVELLARRLRSMDNALADAVFLDVTGRTAKRLLELAGDADEFQLPVTQEELAGLVGASRERVNKALASFIRLGWVEQKERRYKITDRDQLSRRAR